MNAMDTSFADTSFAESAERVLVFVLLCACVLYILKTIYNFRDMGLAVRRNEGTARALSDSEEEERDRDA